MRTCKCGFSCAHRSPPDDGHAVITPMAAGASSCCSPCRFVEAGRTVVPGTRFPVPLRPQPVILPPSTEVITSPFLGRKSGAGLVAGAELEGHHLEVGGFHWVDAPCIVDLGPSDFNRPIPGFLGCHNSHCWCLYWRSPHVSPVGTSTKVRISYSQLTAPVIKCHLQNSMVFRPVSNVGSSESGVNPEWRKM